MKDMFDAELEIIKFNVYDIITTSPNSIEGDTNGVDGDINLGDGDFWE